MIGSRLEPCQILTSLVKWIALNAVAFSQAPYGKLCNLNYAMILNPKRRKSHVEKYSAHPYALAMSAVGLPWHRSSDLVRLPGWHSCDEPGGRSAQSALRPYLYGRRTEIPYLPGWRRHAWRIHRHADRRESKWDVGRQGIPSLGWPWTR